MDESYFRQMKILSPLIRKETIWTICFRKKRLLRKSWFGEAKHRFDEKVANVSLAFELMMDGGLPQPKARPEDIVNLDLKSTLRVLYNLFTKYKHLS